MAASVTLDSARQLLAGSYTVERELGRGGNGVVFLARELSLDRLVAIKVLPPGLHSREEARERFIREARTAAQLSHPNIVPIFRADTVGDMAFFAMGYVDGETLAERVASRGPLPPADAVRILREICWALAYAHARGVVHRDIKPENVMIERGTQRVIVTDFGIARDGSSSHLTAEGTVLGSVHYMSPEQVAGERVDGRSDLYSLGIVAFQLLSGRLPFDAPQASAVLLKQATALPPSLLDVAPGVPERLAQVVDRCLRKLAGERYPSGEELAEALIEAMQLSESGGHLPPERVLDEDTARAVWLRAAQLQADAARQVRERTSRAEEFATGIQPAQPTSGYRLGDVEAAAVEAGIGEEFVQLALAELPDDESHLPASHEVDGNRWHRLVTGNSPQSLRVSRTVDASAAVTLEAIGQVFPAAPFALTFVDTVGGHPLDGGVLTFAARPPSSAEWLTGNVSAGLRYYMSAIDSDRLRVSLHPVAGQRNRCEVTVTVDLRGGLGKNARIGLGLGAGLGGLGSIGGGLALALGAGMGLMAIPAAAGIFLFFAGGMAGIFRVSLKWAIGKVQQELGNLLEAVQAHTRSREVFGTGSSPRLPG